MLGRVSTLALVAGLAFGAPAVAAPSTAKVEAAARQRLEKEGEDVEKKLRQKLEDKLKDLLGQ